MLRRSSLIGVLLLLFVPALSHGMSVITLEDVSEVNVMNMGAELYRAGAMSNGAELPEPPSNPQQFVQELKRVDTVDRVAGGAYWLYTKLYNSTETEQWVFDINNAVIDNIRVVFYDRSSLRLVDTGYLKPHQYSLHYGVDFDLPKGQEIEVLVYLDSRYFSGPPGFEVLSRDQYRSKLVFENGIIISCLGAVLVLALYNLFIGCWIKDPSYLYYSAYLFFSVIAWAAAFNALAEWFGIYTHYALLPPFYLTIAFNVLYYLHFLDLPKSNPKLAYLSYGLMGGAFLLSLSMWLFTPGQYMLIYGVITFLWILLGLVSGIVRLASGYKPARFFVAAFSVVFIGSIVSMLPVFGSTIWVKNNYIVTLVAQTIDILLLALALADRINILRDQKELALQQSYEVEQRAAKKEHEANETLRQALSISEEENQRKSDFLRMVSHELRTPLYSIISSVEQWDDVKDEQGKKDLLEFMSYGAARLRMQVDNLVLLAETDNDDLEVTNTQFEIRPLLDSLFENTRGLLNPGVDFEYKCAESVPVSFVGDAYLFEHMLRTVLENACKYTEHGKIGFYTQWDNDGGFLIIEIADSGCGMSRDQQRTMFNDFVQVSRGLERSSEGLGIGLTVCYRLSELLGVDLDIKSELGKGTRVIFNVSFEVAGHKVVPVDADKIKSSEILIVEDNVVNAQILQSLVNLMGANSTIVESGQDALKVVDEQGFDMVLMDIQMPIMDGITATRWMRRRNHYMPIVAVTANSDADVRKRCVEVGMNDFLVKPIRRSDLQRVMERQLFSKKPY